MYGTTSNGITKEKHLKHWGRLQYGLFLKGAGLSLDDAMVYFERMFVGKDFNKEYAYNVRHMYGKEGKRANYPPYNCAKVINSNAPNSNEHHGCPYKHSTVQDVTMMLNKLGVAPSKQKAIISQKQSNNYQLACVEHFKAVHPNIVPAANDFGNHPNAWFTSSVKAVEGTALTKTVQVVLSTTSFGCCPSDSRRPLHPVCPLRKLPGPRSRKCPSSAPASLISSRNSLPLALR